MFKQHSTELDFKSFLTSLAQTRAVQMHNLQTDAIVAANEGVPDHLFRALLLWDCKTFEGFYVHDF